MTLLKLIKWVINMNYFHVLNWFLQLLIVCKPSTLFNDFVVIKICSVCQRLGYYCARGSLLRSQACSLTLKIAYSGLVIVVTILQTSFGQVHLTPITSFPVATHAYGMVTPVSLTLSCRVSLPACTPTLARASHNSHPRSPTSVTRRGFLPPRAPSTAWLLGSGRGAIPVPLRHSSLLLRRLRCRWSLAHPGRRSRSRLILRCCRFECTTTFDPSSWVFNRSDRATKRSVTGLSAGVAGDAIIFWSTWSGWRSPVVMVGSGCRSTARHSICSTRLMVAIYLRSRECFS